MCTTQDCLRCKLAEVINAHVGDADTIDLIAVLRDIGHVAGELLVVTDTTHEERCQLAAQMGKWMGEGTRVAMALASREPAESGVKIGSVH